jgi:hypothetical protein
MAPYIYSARNGVHIIDLVQTAQLIEDAYEYTIATELLELANKPYGTEWKSVIYTEKNRPPRKMNLRKSIPANPNDPLAIDDGELVDEIGNSFEIPSSGILDITV